MYLVSYSTGHYSEPDVIHLFVTDDEAKAKSYVEKFTTKLNKWKNYYAEMFGHNQDWSHSYRVILGMSREYPRYKQIMNVNDAYCSKVNVR
jgi:uncharacterized membrane protein